ncbi:MAG TPA: cytochrome b N-terminal domain-containing protein, partial [Acidimicrobiales bacterium]|nr:cytochrome b N-terminal domain-containing protein [Acidimicrobiales bacterium]
GSMSRAEWPYTARGPRAETPPVTTFSASVTASAIDLNGPGRYVHWSIFTISEANLVLIAVMVVIFGVALLLPFPGHGDAVETGPVEKPEVGERPKERERREERERPKEGGGEEGGGEDPTMWTARVRRKALALLPPGKLLPDRQPAYVSSWIYVFGVATVAALALCIASGTAIAIGGVDWWHYNPIGHFFNSLHLWSVELFMAFMVIHLWGKFWMAAWRGRRAMTWVTGVVAFLASVVECFTGYLSQQNFDSQWISTNGKDAINSTGLGAFFNLMNFGQMLLWHVVLIPILLITLVGAHVLLVRVRGVSHPLPEQRVKGRAARTEQRRADAAAWRGPTRRYDILKEATLATMVATILVFLLAGFLSSPDVPPVTVASWARVAPADFMGTAEAELAGTSVTANYGPPYNHGSSNLQRIIVSWQLLSGVREPIDPASTFVLSPLAKVASTDPALAAALSAYNGASASEQAKWNTNYSTALAKVTFQGSTPSVPKADDGPVPLLISTELSLAESGALDADLLAQQPFYGTNFTKPLLFLEDGSFYASQAQADHLVGSQWGVMNETGSYPGQPWLWLYTLWYQVPGWKTSANVDMIAIYMTGIATILLLLVPFIPGLRDIPRLVPVHRLVWRSWYREDRARATERE